MAGFRQVENWNLVKLITVSSRVLPKSYETQESTQTHTIQGPNGIFAYLYTWMVDVYGQLVN